MAKKPSYKELEQQVKELENDIIERRRWEEEKYNQLFTTVSDPIMLFDAKMREFLDVNYAAVNLYGYTKEEFLNLNHRDITAEEEKSASGIKQTLNGDLTSIPLRFHKKKDGTIFPVEIATGKFKIGGRQLLCGVVRDITERKQAEEELQKSEKDYRLLVKNLPGFVYKGYKDWSVDFIDRKVELLTGYDVDEFNSKKMIWSDIIFKEDIDAAKESFIKALKSDKSYVREYRINSKAGDTYWIQERGQIICAARGEIEYVHGVFFDITKLKQAEQALQRERDKLEVALAEVKTLSGMLPICSHCKNVRDDKGYWSKIESYFGKHSEAEFSHGICPECADKFYPEYDLYGEDDG